MDYETFDKSLYDYNAGSFCGVLVTEKVMKKLAKLQHQHLEQVKRLLLDSEGEVFPSMWTLHYPEGKQTTVRFIDKSADLESRIKNAVHANGPTHIPLCFVASSMNEAKNMADAHYEQTVLVGESND